MSSASGGSTARRHAIVGIGQSRLGEVGDVTAIGLMTEAILNAAEDAGIDKGEIDGLVTRGPDDIYCHHQEVGKALGINARFSTTLDNGGASQCLAVAMACMAIDAGMCDVVVCGYGRDQWSRTRERRGSRQGSMRRNVENALQSREFGPEYGYFGAIATHALGARRHMHMYGTTKEQLGEVAVAFRDHANRTPWAQMHGRPLSAADYLGGKPVVDPFNRFDCSLRSDAAGAVIVMSEERAKHYRQRPVHIAGWGTANNHRGWFYDDHMVSTPARDSGARAFEMAGIRPSDIDVAQLYDCFTYMVLTQLEDYGFCAKGEGGPFAASGALRLGGALPCNTSGGQLSEAHAEGMLQILEAVRQLRHTEDPMRQVADAEFALVSGHGGNTVCHSSLILQAAS